jgi:hypothetical protein
MKTGQVNLFLTTPTVEIDPPTFQQFLNTRISLEVAQDVIALHGEEVFKDMVGNLVLEALKNRS